MIFSNDSIKNLKSLCPICNKPWLIDSNIKKRMLNTDTGRFKTATNYKDCYRRCLKDQIAISNGKKPRLIFKNIEDNIPKQLLPNKNHLQSLLDTCINIKHKNSKQNQFNFFRSEDAFSWAFFGYICKENLLAKLANKLGLSKPINNILFWGSPYYSNTSEDYKQALLNASNSCNENKNSRTEPDIIICTSEELVFIEIKVDSSNPIIKDSQKYKLDKYRNCEYYKDFNKACSLYELVRNWTLGNIMAKLSCKSFKLINLLPQKYIKKESESQYQIDFCNGLNDVESSYKIMSWEYLFECVDDKYRAYLLTRMNNILDMK